MCKQDLGILVSHPIQYFSPWFRFLAKQLDLTVFYCHRQDKVGQARAGFAREFEWDVPLLEGYSYQWLTNKARRPSIGSFFGCDTPELYDIVQKHRFRAFLVFGWNRKSCLQAVRACWRNKVPVLMRGDSHLGMRRSGIKRIIKRLPYGWFLQRLNGHLYVGQRNREYLRYYHVPDERLYFAPHFVDNEFFAARRDDERSTQLARAIRDEHGVAHEAFLFLYVGKLLPRKRVCDFLVGFASLLTDQKYRGAHALIVGDGPERGMLEGLSSHIRSNCHFAGFRNQSELPAYYRAADVLVLPSDGNETWGLVVNEAMACGVPAIVSDAVGCAPDMIVEGQTGFTFPLGDHVALSARMKLVIDNQWNKRQPELMGHLAAKVRDYSMAEATKGLLRAVDAVRC